MLFTPANIGRRTAGYLSVFWVIVTALACGISDADRWTALEVRASELLGQGQYAEASDIAREAVVLAEELFGNESPSLAASLNNLALILRNQDDAAVAEEAALRALTVSEAAFPPGHDFVAITRSDLERFYSEQGRIAEMIPVYERALFNADATYGTFHTTTSTAYNLASIYQQSGDFSSATSLYIDTIGNHSEALGGSFPAMIGHLSAIGSLYLEYGYVDLAEDVLLKASAIAQEEYGFDHIEAIGLLRQFATLYTLQEEFQDAELAIQRVRRIAEEAYGS